MEHPVLSFLRNYLSDLHLQSVLTDGEGITLSSLDLGLRNSILKVADTADASPFPALEPDTIYHITDYYGCSYSFFQFPSEKKFLFVGPYLTKEIHASDIHSFMDNMAIPPALFPQLEEYYCALPHLSDKNHFSALLRRLYSAIFSTQPPSFCYLDLKTLESREDFLKKHRFFVPEDSVLSMRLLEERYRIEDSLLDAIARGREAQALSIMELLASFRFVPRTKNALRNQKNLMITLNSLLRRTTYLSGVHPFYIDAMSSNYARLIEQCHSVEETANIPPYMVRSYCDLVEKRSMASYSAPIRQILVTVDACLAGDLSLKRFANELFLNTSYLSTLFKKEVGMTLTDYVNKNRIEYAKKLLKSTTLPIQDVAIQSGISDIHYFTRLFRREMGMSPRAWRNRSE